MLCNIIYSIALVADSKELNKQCITQLAILKVCIGTRSFKVVELIYSLNAHGMK